MLKIVLKEYIEEKEISLKFIEGKTGIRYATIHDIVNNKRKGVNLVYLDAIMDAINISDINLVIKKTKPKQEGKKVL